MVGKVLSNILARLRGKQNAASPSPLLEEEHPSHAGVEVVVHPQYWIETNFKPVDNMAPPTIALMNKALKQGLVKDIAKETAQDSVNLLREAVIIQMKEYVAIEDGSWALQGKNGVMSLAVHVTKEEALTLAKKGWENVKAAATRHGIQLNNVKEDWNKKQLVGGVQVLTGGVQIPIDKLQLDIDSTLLWNVLHRNKKSTILWKQKIWMPK